jgi:alpha-1,2-mannosyltransferase
MILDPDGCPGQSPERLAAAAHGLLIPRWVIVLGVVVFAVSAAALAAVNVASSGQLWSVLDLRIYLWGGSLVRHSGDLYASQFPPLQHLHLRFTYPPVAAAVFAILSVLATSTLKWLITIGSIACLITTMWLTWGALGYRRSAGRVGAALAAAGVALWLQPVQQTLWLGQVNLVLMLIIMADLCLPDAARFKGVGVGLAAGFKLTPLIFIGYLLLTRRFRAASVSAAAFALTIAGSLILLPADSQRFWFTGLFLNSGRAGNPASISNQSLHGMLARLLDSVPASEPYWIASSVVVGAGGLLLAAWAARSGHEVIGILTCAVTGLLISPISWAHHWVWAAPMLIVGADIAARQTASQLPPTRPYDRARFPASRQRRKRWVAWAGLAALAAPFLALPQDLAAKGAIAHVGAFKVLTGNLYVITGLVVLSVVGLGLYRQRRSSDQITDAREPRPIGHAARG